MSTAKIRTLQARPLRSADLAFPGAGIIGRQHESLARLGARLGAEHVYDLQGELAGWLTKMKDHPERLIRNAAEVGMGLEKRFLFAQRNELATTQLEQTIRQRQIAFLERYRHRDDIVEAFDEVYRDKVRRLVDLKAAAEERRQALEAAYAQPGSEFGGVVREARTIVANTGQTLNKIYLTPVRMHTDQYGITGRENQTVGPINNTPHAFQAGAWKAPAEMSGSAEPQLYSQKTVIDDTGHQQASLSRGMEFRHPRLENRMSGQRGQVDVQDEILAARLTGVMVPDLQEILETELETLDLEVIRSAIQYAQTFLATPFPGLVTAVYKDVGEAVQPGEPVIRVEDDETLLLVGVLHFRGVLRPERGVRIRTAFGFEAKESLDVTGELVSIRGHDSDDDEWDVIIRCANPRGRIIPLNYHFDRDTTTVEVLGT